MSKTMNGMTVRTTVRAGGGGWLPNHNEPQLARS
jgi:hypothetical protein